MVGIRQKVYVCVHLTKKIFLQSTKKETQPLAAQGVAFFDEPNLTLIAISNSTDYKVDYVIVLDQYLDTVKRVTENTSGDVAYDLTTIDGAHMNILHGDAAKDDYVIVTNIGNDDDVLNFEKAETISANITKLTGVSNSNLTRSIVGQDSIAYQTNNTVYFYVDGCKNADGTYTYGSGLSVGVRVGVNNAANYRLLPSGQRRSDYGCYQHQRGIHRYSWHPLCGGCR